MLFFIVIFVSAFILEKVVRKKYNIEPDSEPFRYMSNPHQWGERILLLLAFIFLILSCFTNNLLMVSFALLTVLCLQGVRIFIEYKYDKEEKEYIITMIWTAGNFCLLIFIVYYF